MPSRYPRIPSELRTLNELIESLASFGDEPAIIAFGEKDAERWSYAELARRVEQSAHGLAAQGIGRGSRVALMAPNSPEWIAAALSVVRAGGTVVPVDIHADEETLKHILLDSDARLFIAGAEQLEALREAEGGHMPPTVLLDAPAEEPRSWRALCREGNDPFPDVSPEDAAVQFYTSGTTGMPKGVPLTHLNMTHQLKAIQETKVLEVGDRVLMPLPLNHVYSLDVGTLAPLSVGLPVILPHALTGPEVVRALKEGGGTVMVGVPRLYSALVQGIEARAAGGGFVAALYFRSALGLSLWLRRTLGWRTGRVLLKPMHKKFAPGLRTIACGGALLDPAVAWKLEGLGWKLAIGYGLTETSPLLTAKLPEHDHLDTVGKPVMGVDVKIDPTARTVDEEGAAREGRIERGEILARGPSVFRGYYNLPEQTAEAFKDGWFRTGDLGYIDEDGYLHIEGRVSTVIVTEAGKNVQPDEVEEAYAQHPTIREAGILGRDGKLVAVIVPEPGKVAALGEDVETAVREAVEDQSRKLASYKRIADYVVSQEPLPRTRLDKIRRGELRKRFDALKEGRAGAAAAGAMAIEDMDEEDRALLQEPKARKMWQWLVGHFPEHRLTPDSNLQLDLGVDSLEWLNLTMDLSDQAGIVLDEEAIGRVETVRDLLEEVSRIPEGAQRAVSPEAYLARPEEFLTEEQKRWIRPLSPLQAAVRRMLYMLNWVLARVLFRVRAEGVENLPEGQYVLAPNHISYIDPFVLTAVTDYGRARRTYWAGWTGVAFGNALTRTFSRLSHVVPVDPDQAVASSLAFGAAVLKNGHNLAWFPEGTRSESGQLQAFKPGIGMLLEHYATPVVPVLIRGTYEAWPRDRALPRPYPVRIVFGKPVDPRELAEEGHGETPHHRITQALRERVRALAREAEL